MSVVNSGDTAFVLLSAALVMLMTPGLGFFYGGLVRSKNFLTTIMHSLIAMPLIGLEWILLGYSLSFGPDIGGMIGSLDWVGLKGVGMSPFPSYSENIPHLTFMIYQAMFAIITPALISGAMAERVSFKGYLAFSLAWSVVVYNVLAHWVWGAGGWLREMGALDFAGGNVVHISAGMSSLAAAMLMGPRTKLGDEKFEPHHVPMVLLGTGLLWFGWLGFNSGSALSANETAALAFMTTNAAAWGGAASWMMLEWFQRGKATPIGFASGAVAGLVAITPAAGYVSTMPAVMIGVLGGTLCYAAIELKNRLGYDDALDAFGIHGVGGIWGALATGIFAQKSLNPLGSDGAWFGNWHQLGIQAISIGVCAGYAFLSTIVIYKAVDALIGMRVSPEDELKGLDLKELTPSELSTDNEILEPSLNA